MSASLYDAVRAEFRRAFTTPYEAPVVVAVNGLLVTGAWFLIPSGSLFRSHSAWFFPLTLASWMLADVPATNVLGSDPARMSRVLDRAPDLRRMLAAKSVVLCLLVVPICVGVVIGLAVHDQALLAGLATIAALVTVPFGTLAIAAWVGVRWPYHVLPLRERWENRRSFRRMVVRWLVLVLIPYMVVPFVAGVLLLPVLAGWRVTSGSWLPTTEHEFTIGALAFALIAGLAWAGGRAVTVRLVRRRAPELHSFLNDPSQG